jgi:hypothetical protein
MPLIGATAMEKIGCFLFGLLLVVLPIWLMIDMGGKGNMPAPLGFVMFLGAAILWTVITGTGPFREQCEKELKEAKRAEEERLRLQQRADEERRSNSPEEVERRRLEAERREAEKKEWERRWKEDEEKKARAKWADYHRYMRIEEVDGMDGREFERFMKIVFERHQFKDVRETPASGDQGGDLICLSPDDKITVVQAKRWEGRVGNRAIQEVLGGLLFYGAEIAYVTTTSYFTEAAKALAKKDPRISLVDREALERMIREVFPREVPDFDWGKYNEYVRDWRPPRPLPPPTSAPRSNDFPF